MKYTFSVNNETVNAKVEVKLADDCNNGHEDFSVTGTFWEVGEIRSGRTTVTSGCCHELIEQHFPELKSFIALHLCDFQGAPMYAIYHAQPGKHHDEDAGPESLAEYFRIPLFMAEKLCMADDKDHFAFLIEESKVDEMWLLEAQAAISKLEQLTGEKFESKAIKSHFKRLEGDARKAMMDKIESGFYTPEAIRERQKAERSRLIGELVMDYRRGQEKDLEAINVTAEVNVTLAALFPEKHGNWLYWHKDKTLNFNRSSLNNKFKDKEIDKAMEAVRLIVPDVKKV